MKANLPPSASVATRLTGTKLHAPSAARNVGFLCDFLREHAPAKGKALELASGTGQHIIAFADALPDLMWQPTDVDEARLASIDAYVTDAGLCNIQPAVFLDATRAGWCREHVGKQLVLVVNLLHLIGQDATTCLINDAMNALDTDGKLVLYGPFKRDGKLTSAGDVTFDAELRAADEQIGYKNDTDITAWLAQAGASDVRRVEMPANNLAIIATKNAHQPG